MKKSIAVRSFLLALMASCLVSCETGSPKDYNQETQTGVVPRAGDYSFSVSQSSFRVLEGTGTVRSVVFAVYGNYEFSMPVNNGEFHYQNGVVGDNGDSDSGDSYPGDGFRIMGHFDSPTQASGTVVYVSYGSPYETDAFTASLR